ncbi:MAG: NAD(P)/FAD-dependent oxidoreductase [Deltaproteobacteria bacterium]|nr:NAD(P)/FAD-dependent oxidoreductase [Deltaproteobacteria bacterium]
MGYDVIIAGASFAGLAVASRLRGKVLLLEPHAIGEHQTSACAIPLSVAEKLGLMDSVLRVLRRLVIHARSSKMVVDLSAHPYCTVDYKKFCCGMAAGVRAEVLRAHVLGRERNRVATTRGSFEGEILVDASGWRAVLAGRKGTRVSRRKFLSFGIETVAAKAGDKLGFWSDLGILFRGFAWDFPIDTGSRIGLASYVDDHRLRGPLEIFLARWGLARGEIHGGYFTSALRAPIEQDLFLVGDAAGQCLPLTGEGIRPAIYFGQACGAVIQRILNGELTLEAGREVYESFVLRHQRLYRALRFAQSLGVKLPPRFTSFLLALACTGPSLSYILPRYMALADTNNLHAARGSELQGKVHRSRGRAASC